MLIMALQSASIFEPTLLLRNDGLYDPMFANPPSFLAWFVLT
jgi:hypothetical protein